MTAKDYMRKIRGMEFKLRGLEEAIIVLDSKRKKITSSWSDIPTASGVSDRAADLTVKLIETQHKYIREWDELIDARNEAEKILARMDDDTHANVLWSYYIRCKTWEQVAVEMGFSESYTYTMHGLALNEFERLMQESSK